MVQPPNTPFPGGWASFYSFLSGGAAVSGGLFFRIYAGRQRFGAEGACGGPFSTAMARREKPLDFTMSIVFTTTP